MINKESYCFLLGEIEVRSLTFRQVCAQSSNNSVKIKR